MTTIDRNAGAHGQDSHGGEHHEGSYLEGKGGIWPTVVDWATTVDHKKLGVMYLVAILVLFFLGGVAALALRTELMAPPRVTTSLVNGVPTEKIEGTLRSLRRRSSTGTALRSRISAFCSARYSTISVRCPSRT